LDKEFVRKYYNNTSNKEFVDYLIFTEDNNFKNGDYMGSAVRTNL
jgi:hypothetical protein